jgi:hypothetical protein
MANCTHVAQPGTKVGASWPSSNCPPCVGHVGKPASQTAGQAKSEKCDEHKPHAYRYNTRLQNDLRLKYKSRQKGGCAPLRLRAAKVPGLLGAKAQRALRLSACG